MELKMIAAVSRNGIIGKEIDGKPALPWGFDKYPADMKFFRKITAGGHVIFGRKTYESIGKPLPKRTNIVITRQERIDGVYCHPSLESYVKKYALVLEDCHTDKWICGGYGIYQSALQLPELKEIFLTLIPEVVDGEKLVSFPWIDPSRFVVAEIFALPDSDIQVTRYVRVK